MMRPHVRNATNDWRCSISSTTKDTMSTNQSLTMPSAADSGQPNRVWRLSILRTLCLLLIPMAACGGFASCTGWQMDYGKPAAQFHQGSLAEKGQPYIGKKITVKGKVARVDTSNPEVAWVWLEGGIRCNFGKFDRMAKGNKVGDIVHVDGFLRRCEPGDILLDPALNRDPTTTFNPL